MTRAGRHLRRAAGDARGAALLEFALVLPVFLSALVAMVSYGGYFWRAHSLQQVANDAARAGLPGLTAPEREGLTRGAATSESAAVGLDPTRVTTAVTEDANVVTVALAYDGSRDVFLHLGFVPMPVGPIRRIAAVRLGGL